MKMLVVGKPSQSPLVTYSEDVDLDFIGPYDVKTNLERLRKKAPYDVLVEMVFVSHADRQALRGLLRPSTRLVQSLGNLVSREYEA